MFNILGKSEQEVLPATRIEAGGKTPFRKQFGWHIQQGEAHAAIVTVTPAIAAELLKHNAGDGFTNRAQSEPTIAKYQRAMKLGWRLTGETIIVSKTGRLLNGQHRLVACVRSGCSFPSFVVFGIDDDAFSFMDIGKKRSAGDIFHINGVKNAAQMAAATQWLWKYRYTGMQTPASHSYPTHEELYNYYLDNIEIVNSTRAGARFNEERMAPGSLMTALHYIAASFNRKLADDFFEKVATGIGLLSAKDPASKLRKRLIKDKDEASKLPDMYVAAFTAQAWNAVRQNKPIEIFRWRGEQNPDQPFPRLV